MASRASRRAQRLRSEQELGDPSTEVLRRIAAAERTRRNYSQGAEGERMVAQTLGFLSRYGWVVLHDLRWPDRPRANIDHIAIGPGGVFIIDAKLWSGDVHVTSDRFTQNGYSRTENADAVCAATAAVTALLAPQHRLATNGMIALAGQEVEPTRVHGVTVVGRGKLAEFLVSLPEKLTAYEVADIGRYLFNQLAVPPVELAGSTAGSTAGTAPRKRRARTGTGSTKRRRRAQPAARARSTPNRRRGKSPKRADSGGELAQFGVFMALLGGALFWLNR